MASAINVKKSVAPEMEAEAEKALLSSLNAHTNALYKATERLEAVLKGFDEARTCWPAPAIPAMRSSPP